LIRWLTTVDHKDIGMLYGLYAVVAFAVGGSMVMITRTELLDPAATLIGAEFYNGLVTSHGITMLFLFGTPIIAAFSNYFIPLIIGADDMAFPRINAIAFWLLPPGAILIWAGFFVPGLAPAQTAWTMYTPLSAGVGAHPGRRWRRSHAAWTPSHRRLGDDGCDQLHRDHLHRARGGLHVGEPRHLLLDDPHPVRSHSLCVPAAR